jgi:hypothetical protein
LGLVTKLTLVAGGLLLIVAGDVGALYKLDNGLTLRAEAGSDGLKLGAGWLF